MSSCYVILCVTTFDKATIIVKSLLVPLNWQRKKIVTSRYIVDGACKVLDRYTIADLPRYAADICATLSLCSSCLLYLWCLRSQYYNYRILNTAVLTVHCILQRSQLRVTQPQKYEHNLLLSSWVCVGWAGNGCERTAEVLKRYERQGSVLFC